VREGFEPSVVVIAMLSAVCVPKRERAKNACGARVRERISHTQNFSRSFSTVRNVFFVKRRNSAQRRANPK
jgi:hypothetical protein